jgi:hypothetical protein
MQFGRFIPKWNWKPNEQQTKAFDHRSREARSLAITRCNLVLVRNHAPRIVLSLLSLHAEGASLDLYGHNTHGSSKSPDCVRLNQPAARPARITAVRRIVTTATSS